MRQLFLLCLLVLLLAPAQSAENPASIVGTIRDPTTGQHATNFQIRAEVRGEDGIGVGASATGQTPGTYELKNLKPGTYRLVVSGSFEPGYAPEIQRTVTLAEGQKVTMDFALIAPAVISGRIFDESGQPAQGVRVKVIDKYYSRGALRYWPIGRGQTDKLGRYEIRALPIGRSLIVRADASDAPGESPADTYFPETLSPADAQEIVLTPGEERRNVDIRQINRSSYCVDGLAESGAGFDSMSWEITRSLSNSDWLPGPTEFLRASGEPLQKFLICGLHDGHYQIGVNTGNLNKANFRLSEGVFDIHGENVRGLRLRPQAPVTISGETVWDGEPPVGHSDAKISIHLTGTLRFGGGVLGEPTVPQSFSVSGSFLPEEYLIDRVTVVRGEGVYIKDLTWDGNHPPGNRVTLDGERGDHIQVVVGGDGASASVKVNAPDGNSVSDMYVAMIPTSAAGEEEMSGAMIFGQADQNGNLRADAIPPGKYRVLAITNLPDGAANNVNWSIDHDLAAHLVSALWRARGQLVDVGPNAKAEFRLESQTLP